MYGRGKKVSKQKAQNEKKKKEKIDEIKGMIRNIWTLFETEEEKEKTEIREKKTLIIDYIKIEQLEILGHFLSNSNNKKIIINQK